MINLFILISPFFLTFSAQARPGFQPSTNWQRQAYQQRLAEEKKKLEKQRAEQEERANQQAKANEVIESQIKIIAEESVNLAHQMRRQRAEQDKRRAECAERQKVQKAEYQKRFWGPQGPQGLHKEWAGELMDKRKRAKEQKSISLYEEIVHEYMVKMEAFPGCIQMQAMLEARFPGYPKTGLTGNPWGSLDKLESILFGGSLCEAEIPAGPLKTGKKGSTGRR